jgi:aminopeptidase N
MNDTFRHRTVTHEEVTAFWSARLGRDLKPLFDQYLKTTKIPVLRWRIRDRKLYYRWTDCIDGYDVPVKINIKPGEDIWLEPTTSEKVLRLPKGVSEIRLHPDIYAKIEKE